MKVKELIEQLECMPENAEVYIDNEQDDKGWFAITGCESENTEEVLLNWER